MNITAYVVLSAILFSIGTVGVLTRRNAIVVFMCVELMLNAVNLTFVALSQVHGLGGQIMVFFVMTVAAAEVEAAGFPLKKGSMISLYPPVSSPRVACPYQVSLLVIRASFAKYMTL